MQNSIWRKPSAWIPIACSVAALAVVLTLIVINGGAPHGRDEGAAAHLWQIFMLADALGIGYFLLRWVSMAPRKALVALAVQIGAALTALLLVGFLRL